MPVTKTPSTTIIQRTIGSPSVVISPNLLRAGKDCPQDIAKDFEHLSQKVNDLQRVLATTPIGGTTTTTGGGGTVTGGTGPQGPAGPKGDKGDPGIQGPKGDPGQSSTMFEYDFNVATTAPPNVGEVRLNNTNQTLATLMWVSDTTGPPTGSGSDISLFLHAIPAGSTIGLQDQYNSSNYQVYQVTTAPVDHGAYFEIGVSWTEGGAPVLAGRAAPTTNIFLVILSQGSGVHLGGDIGGTTSTPVVIGIQGNGVSPVAPTNGQVLTWVSADNKWEPKPATGAGGVPTTRLINTTSPLFGGGDLSADRTLGVVDFSGDLGSGGSRGTVPAPSAGDAAAGKFLKANGAWVTPPTGSAGGVTQTILINGVGVSDDPIITFNAQPFILFNGA